MTTLLTNWGTGNALDTADGLLKDVYLPGITDTIFNDTAFTALIQSRTDVIDYVGRRIVTAFRKQRSAGVGSITEGGNFVDSVPTKGQQGSETLAYLNLYFSISGPMIATAKQGMGAFVDVVTDHFETIAISAKNDFERQLMGAQDGKLAKWTDTAITGAASVSYDVTGPAFFDTQYLEPGMSCQFHATLGTEKTAVDGTNAFLIVDSITKGSKKTGGVTRGTVKWTEAATANIASNDFITRKNAYSGSTCLEINGLYNLVSDGAATNVNDFFGSETATNFASIWGLSRATNTYLQSQMSNVSAELDEEVLLDAMIESKYQFQGRPNLLVVSPRALQKYFLNTKDDRRFNTMDALQWTGGYTGLGIQLGTDKLMLTSIPSVPSGSAFMINTNDFAFASASNGYQWLTGGQGVLRQKEGSDAQFATAVNYINFVCFDPHRQVKLYIISE